MAKRSSKTKQAIATVEPIEPVIHVIRGLRVIFGFGFGEDLWSDDKGTESSNQAQPRAVS